MIKVLIADDHPAIRQGLKRILDAEADMKGADEAQNTQEALDLAGKKHYDVLLLDIDMPGRSGLDALKELRTQQPNLPVLVLSIHHEEQYAARVLEAGGAGYLMKETAPEDLVEAIRRALEGGKYVSPSIGERLSAHGILPRDRGGPESQLE
jgi:two-component system invasion response regulator UvrY